MIEPKIIADKTSFPPTFCRDILDKNLLAKNIFQQKHHAKFVLVAWLIVQCLLFWRNGIFDVQEAEKYISQADHFIAHGNFSTHNYWLYSTLILLIAAAKILHLGYFPVILLQWVLNLFATYMFYKLAAFFLRNASLALLASLIFIINIPYQQYNTFLFTESLFYSLTIIYSSYLLRLKNFSVKTFISIFLFLILLSITRPTGILFFSATAVYIFFRFLNHLELWKKLMLISFSAILFFVILNQMLQAGGSLDFMLPFKKENIICGVNTTYNIEIKTSDKGNSVQGILYYIFNNKEQFFRLAKLKTISFFGLMRNYYSPFHNIYLVIFFYPFYLLSLVSLWKFWKKKNDSFMYILSIIMLYWITTLLTCDDWHNRFILTVTPFIFLIGLYAFTKNNEADSKQA